MHLKVYASQILAVWSNPADNTFVPWGLNTAFDTYPSCPSKTPVQANVDTLYILIVVSTDAVTRDVPIALKLKSKI